MKTRLFFIMMFISSLSFGQKINQVKLYYGFVRGVYIPLEQLKGAGSSDDFQTSEFGIRYNRKIGKHFRIETGINYFSSDVRLESAPLPEIHIFSDKVQLITVPVSLIFEFLNYFYVNGGLLFDFQAKETRYLDSQSGIGAVLGLGVKYNYKDFVFYLNPEVRRHRIIGFKNERYPKFLLNSTIQIGLGYNF